MQWFRSTLQRTASRPGETFQIHLNRKRAAMRWRRQLAGNSLLDMYWRKLEYPRQLACLYEVPSTQRFPYRI